MKNLLILSFVALLFACNSKKTNTDYNIDTIIKYNKINRKKDSINKIKEEKELFKLKLNQIKNFKIKNSYLLTIDDILGTVNTINDFAEIINNIEKSNNDSLKIEAKRLRKKLIQIQIQQFPLLRIKYIKLSKEKLWEYISCNLPYYYY